MKVHFNSKQDVFSPLGDEFSFFPLFPPHTRNYDNLQQKLDCVTTDELTPGALVMDTAHDVEEPAMASGAEVD